MRNLFERAGIEGTEITEIITSLKEEDVSVTDLVDITDDELDECLDSFTKDVDGQIKIRKIIKICRELYALLQSEISETKSKMYALKFATEGMTVATLKHATLGDLKGIGVRTLGDQLKIKHLAKRQANMANPQKNDMEQTHEVLEESTDLPNSEHEFNEETEYNKRTKMDDETSSWLNNKEAIDNVNAWKALFVQIGISEQQSTLYGLKFSSEEVTRSSLQAMSENHLVLLGVNSVGDRLKILKAAKMYLLTCPCDGHIKVSDNQRVLCEYKDQLDDDDRRLLQYVSSIIAKEEITVMSNAEIHVQGDVMHVIYTAGKGGNMFRVQMNDGDPSHVCEICTDSTISVKTMLMVGAGCFIGAASGVLAGSILGFVLFGPVGATAGAIAGGVRGAIAGGAIGGTAGVALGAGSATVISGYLNDK